MTTNTIPRLAPEILLRPINEEYAFAVNCSVPHSLRVLNIKQYHLLKAINGIDSSEEMSTRLSIAPEAFQSFLVSMERSEIVRFDETFSSPKRPALPKSLNFWIHTTNACNLGCSYCYISTLNTGRGMTDSVKEQLLQKFVETVRSRSLKHIKLRLAGGEPLTQFTSWKTFIPRAKRVLADEGCQLDVAFITNLTMLTSEVVDFSSDHDITYGVSVDGVGDTHDLTRRFRSGLGSFGMVDSNLRKLLASGIPVSVTTVLSNNNLHGLADLTRYLIDLNLPFRYSIVKGEAIDAELLDENLSQSFKIMEEAIRNGWQFSKRFQFCDLKPNELGFQTCASGFSGGAIYTDGSLKYCHVHFGDDNEPSFSIFDDQTDLFGMIEQGRHFEDDKSEDCRKCRFRFVCTSGCPVYRINGKDPQCSLYHKFIPRYYELFAKERLKLLQDCKIIE